MHADMRQIKQHRDLKNLSPRVVLRSCAHECHDAMAEQFGDNEDDRLVICAAIKRDDREG